MKKILPYLFVAALTFSCSNDDDKTVTHTDPDEIITLPCASKESVVLLTQADVNAFKDTDYCSVLNLTIGSEDGMSNITDLTPLKSLLNVEGSLKIINNPYLQNLKGLHNIINIGGYVLISNNNLLEDLEGLEGIKTLGNGLGIVRNNNLKSIAILKNATIHTDANIEISFNENLEILGLEGFTSLGELYIWDNASLKNLNGLSGLKSVSLLRIQENEQFQSLNGLDAIENIDDLRLEDNSSLESIAGVEGITLKSLTIKGTSFFNSLTPMLQVAGLENIIFTNNLELTNIDALANFTVMNNITITDNPKLISLNGLSGLTEITNKNSNDFPNGLGISNNKILETLEGLQNVTSFEGFINISGNEVLANFCAIQNIIDNGDYEGYFFNITGNLYQPDFTVEGGCSMN